MIEGDLIKQDSMERPEGTRKFCEFHVDEGHDIQKCTEFRTMVQNLMDKKELEFYEEMKGLEEGEVYASEEGSAGKTQRVNHPVVIISRPRSTESGIQIAPRVLNETYVVNDISVNKLDRLVNNISADNFIFFNNDELPPEGRGATKALHITTRCGEYTLPGVLIDNRSALNVLPLSTLNRLSVDSSHMKSCQNILRAFDGTERRVMGRIEIPLLIGLNIYEVDFLVMDIKPLYNYLLGRPRIHSARAVSSLLHQNLKLVTEGLLVTINAEEDIIASVTSDTPYLGTVDEAIECSF
ncbi:uncharacterized protein [Gossypium hirsutum]|uniref:Uncharacterized protein n=1 Tax=Gossypium hirsutum TaxID=3635 RepID=A0ABM3A9F4_GOSHI|nr:uncharacterized protein LOC121218371 [Gossypium hirsutum]